MVKQIVIMWGKELIRRL